ncbi:unnamed protein product [Pleuronectes platessa]|uniref:Uncharacterized protein n=1 Tax=Pleuronectes platessa TaxID=8262 RepID=A0A9N7TH80_PLEPL|nr:unnamed protein product [Pleuronectes platessa]
MASYPPFFFTTAAATPLRPGRRCSRSGWGGVAAADTNMKPTKRGVRPVLDHGPRSLTHTLKVKSEGRRTPSEVGFQPSRAPCTPLRTPLNHSAYSLIKEDLCSCAEDSDDMQSTRPVYSCGAVSCLLERRSEAA